MARAIWLDICVHEFHSPFGICIWSPQDGEAKSLCMDASPQKDTAWNTSGSTLLVAKRDCQVLYLWEALCQPCARHADVASCHQVFRQLWPYRNLHLCSGL